MNNLIEKLGGYGKAKWWEHHLIQAEKKGIHHNGVNSALLFTLRELQELLLDHRRQHNIFEEGGAIVRRWNGRVYWIITDVDNGSEFMISENKDAKFKDCKVCDMPCNFTHATPEEIALGYRK